MNVKNVLWAFTFLCQFGFYGLNLMLTQSGGGGESAVVESARNLSADAMCRDRDRGSGKRLGTFAEEIMSKGVCDGPVPDRGGSKPGRRA